MVNEGAGVTFHEGRPLAPMPPLEWVSRNVQQVRNYYAGRQPVFLLQEGVLEVGLRRGWLAGWHAGFAAATDTPNLGARSHRMGG